MQSDPTLEPRISRGLRYMATGALFFSVMSLLVKLVGQRLPTQEIVLARSLIMALICYVSMRRRGISPLGQRRGLHAGGGEWVSNHRRSGRETPRSGALTDSALSEHYIRNQYRAWRADR